MLLALSAAAAIAVCAPPPAHRFHCVHDGDTVWWEGEKIRISDIDTPELDGKCPSERRRALAARDRLVELLNRPGVRVERAGFDFYHRRLARFGDVGDQLVREGHARAEKRRRSWCPGSGI
jgi:micrococcal nuclease